MAGNNYGRWCELGNTQKWLEQTKIKTAPVSYKSPPAFPYQVFFDDTETSGPDSSRCMLIRHNIRVEQYQETKSTAHEAAIEALLSDEGLDYAKWRVWLPTEEMYMTTYEFELFEKRRYDNG